MYRDRRHAGQELARLLREYEKDRNVRVLALPRGGVPVAAEVAATLNAPLDILVVRKVGLPWQPELAAGAIAPGGVVVRNPDVSTSFTDLDEALAPVITAERRELQRREALYRKGRAQIDVQDRIVILIDDGIATGSTMEAAVGALRALHARSVIVAVPVAPPDTIERLSRLADCVICPNQPEPFVAVGRWYDDFPQLSDDEVIAILAGMQAPQTHGVKQAADGDAAPTAALAHGLHR